MSKSKLNSSAVQCLKKMHYRSVYYAVMHCDNVFTGLNVTLCVVHVLSPCMLYTNCHPVCCTCRSTFTMHVAHVLSPCMLQSTCAVTLDAVLVLSPCLTHVICHCTDNIALPLWFAYLLTAELSFAVGGDDSTVTVALAARTCQMIARQLLITRSSNKFAFISALV